MNSRQDGQPTRTRAIDSEILEKYIESIALLEQQIENLKKRERTLTRLTASLERRNLRLEELNAMKDEFIGIASHQLRTPATGVKQYINLLLDGFADDLNDNQKMFLERANESNDRQLHIIDDLLRVARIDSDGFAIRKTEVDPVLMVEEVADILKSKLDRRHQQLVIKKPKQSISVNADPDNLRMVLENLIDNASSLISATATWQTVGATTPTTPCNYTASGTYTAGGTMTLRIRLTATNANDHVRVAAINLPYLSKW
jgi:signal transduction histidine kinase